MEQHLRSLLHSPLHLNQLKQIHSLIITKYFNLTSIFLKHLLHRPFIKYAGQVFDQIPHLDTYLYNSVISAYSRQSLNNEALGMFCTMHRNNIQFDRFTFAPILRSCTSLSASNEGKQVHSLLINFGFDSNIFIQTALVHFYAKTGYLDSAEQVFDKISVKDPVAYNFSISGYSKSREVFKAKNLFDKMNEKTIVSWNSMISCYAHNGDLREGLGIFERMQSENCRPDQMTLVTVLSICAKLGDLERGLSIKKFIDEIGVSGNMIVSTAILEMYVKCGAVDEARLEFDRMGTRDVVTWSAMIAGYAQNGRSNEALELFEQMKAAMFKPNDVTLVSVASACGQLGSVEAGERIGSYIESQGFDSNVYVCSALFDMYAKCGNIRKARELFGKMNRRDIVSWNSMIRGLAFNGFSKDAIDLFMEMKDTEVKPNDITFVGLLSACTHAGFVELGCKLYETMRTVYNIVPKVEHCACIVDLLCKSGQIEKAYNFITKMEVEPNVVVWGTLLSACRINSNIEVAEHSAEQLLVLEPENSGNYVLLSNIYAAAGKWQEAMKVRNMMRNRSLQKTVAYSWIELDNMVHKFLVEDTSHPMSSEIYNAIDELVLQSKMANYVPGLDLKFL